MPRRGLIVNKHNFSGGMITEGSLLSDAENVIVRDTVNFDYDSLGRAVKRKGLDLEDATEGDSSFDVLTGASFSSTAGKQVWTFNNVDAEEESGIDVAIIRLGNTLVVSRLGQDESLQDHITSTEPHVQNSVSRVTVEGDLSLVKIQGRVMVLQPNSVRWLFLDSGEWQISDNLVSTSSAEYGGAIIRDFEGVGDNLEVDEEPSVLTNPHKYNLLNQGWTETRINEYFTARGRYPSNSQVWYEGRDTDNEFDPEELQKISFGRSPAPKGRALISAISLDRASAFDSVTSDGMPDPISVDPNSGYMFRTGTTFGSRVALGGNDVETARRKVFISPIISSLSRNESVTLTTGAVVEDGILVAASDDRFGWWEDSGSFSETGDLTTTNDGITKFNNRVAYSPDLDLFVSVFPDWSATSGDGKSWSTWTQHGFPSFAGERVNDVIWANGFFYAFGDGYVSSKLRSSDGVNWNSFTTSLNVTNIVNAAYSPNLGRFACVTPDGIFYSNDALTWTDVTPLDFEASNYMVMERSDEAERFVCAASGLIFYSEDGLSWTLAEEDNAYTEPSGLAYSPVLGIWALCYITVDFRAPQAEELKIKTAPANAGVWNTQSTSPIGPRWVSMHWLSGPDVFIALHADNTPGNPQMFTSPDGSTWTQSDLYAPGAWSHGAVKQPVISTAVTGTFNKFFEKVFQFYQINDPTADISNELLADDGLVIEISDIDSVVKLASLANALLVMGENGVWALTGVDILSGFRTDDYMQYKVSNYGTRYKDSVIEAGNSIFYWGDGGIYQLALGQTSRMEVSNLTEFTINEFYKGIGPDSRANAIGYHDQHNKKIYWAYHDPTSTVGNTTDRNAILVLNLSTGGFYPYRLNDMSLLGTDYATGIVGFTQDPNYPNTDGTIPLKVVVQRRDTEDSENVQFSVMEFNDENFVDFNTYDGADSLSYPAYLETWPEVLQQPNTQKQALWVHTYFLRTETGFEEDSGGGLVPVNPSSCTMQGRWDWHNSSAGNRFSQERQVYRYRRFYVPADSDDIYDTGEEIIHTQNKVRGKGSALSLRFNSTPGYNTVLLGYDVVYSAETAP